MRKLTLATALLLCASAHAGGYLTNTNQSVAFLRNPARDAAIGIDGAYFNPAGIGFLSRGWHLSLNVESAYQTREITSNLGSVNNRSLFALGQGNPADGVKTFKGKAQAPVFPTLDLAAVYNKWFFSAHFGITGGGGKCTYDKGLGSFESQVAMLPVIVNTASNAIIGQNAAAGYSYNSYVSGRQYYIGGQFNAGYRINNKLNLSLGVRAVYATTNYYGYVRDMKVITTTGQAVDLSTLLTQFNMPTLAKGVSNLTKDRNLNCDQSGWGVTPILGIDWKSGRWNLAAKWELKTRLRLKNKSGENTSGLDEFNDGKTIPADLPTILAGGIQYTALNDSSLRFNVGAHLYRDKAATQYQHRENKLGGDGFEFLGGVEWDVKKWATVSLGAQYTNYGLGKGDFLNNISFVTDSWSLGFGAKFQVRKNIAINVAYFKTFYLGFDKHMKDYNDLKANLGGQLSGKFKALGDAARAGQVSLTPTEQAVMSKLPTALATFNTAGTDRFDRTNDVFGVSLDINF